MVARWIKPSGYNTMSRIKADDILSGLRSLIVGDVLAHGKANDLRIFGPNRR